MDHYDSFTMEYLLRIYVSPKVRNYVFSLMGIIDLLAIVPTYLAFGVASAHTLVIVRAFRLLRVFRILKLYHVLRAGNMLVLALRKSALGKFVSSFIMLLGYSIIAIPTGIVSVEMSRTFNNSESVHNVCPNCKEENHLTGSSFCRNCGTKLK